MQAVRALAGERSLPEIASHRPDIDGLRAIAIALVVAFHARIPGFSAGFIGVDVFFVLSGFLITRLLLREIDTDGRIDLLAFWARRGRRLLPAATLVLVVTGAAALVVLPPLQLQRTAGELAAAAGYVSNLLFARQANYFASDAPPSPVLHTWSLAVEEQFYVGWPLLLTVVARFTPKNAHRKRIIAVVAGTTLVSFWLSLALGIIRPRWAFFGSPARAWEFGVGALLAALLVAPRRRNAIANLGCAAGVAAIAVAAATLSNRGPYPGWLALWPVAGTAAVIASGSLSHDAWLVRLLGSRPLGYLGRISYAWYLWHWPLLALAEYTPGRHTHAALGLALLAAIGTHHAIENPIRFHPALVRSKRKTYLTLLGLMASSALVCAALLAKSRHDLRDPTVRALAQAAGDAPSIFIDPCGSTDPNVLAAHCSFGAPRGKLRVLLLGDSHAHAWTPALDEIGRRDGWRGIYSGTGGCPVALVEVARPDQREYVHADCARWHAGLAKLIAANPVTVIAASSSAYPAVGWLIGPDGEHLHGDTGDAWQAGVEKLVDTVRNARAELIYLLDVPRLPARVPGCIQERRSFAACAPTLEETTEMTREGRRRERAALDRQHYGRVVDPLPLFCDSASCPLERDGVVVFTDTNHISASYARPIAGSLARSLAIRP